MSASARTGLLDLDVTPVDVFGAFAGESHAAFLDAGTGKGWGGVSVVAWSPRAILSSRGRRIRLERVGRVITTRGDPLEAVRSLLEDLRPHEGADGAGGMGSSIIGYLGYELGGSIEKLPMTRRDDLGAPEMYLVHYGAVLAFDHGERRWWLTAADRRSWPVLRREVERRVRGEPARRVPPAHAQVPRSNFRRADYHAAIRKAKHHIRDGDIYQVNLSQRFSAALPEEPWQLYLRLRRVNPAPYACYLKYPELAVAGSSPELFLRVSGGEVLTRPIKGTRRRGASAGEDRRLARELEASVKDRAELSMIVDLERNDLGRVCRPGTVRVREHARVERHPTVLHTVSSVVGVLQEGKDLVDLLRATFPGGSVTGCPKIRAMEIIDDLEPTTRGPYTGSMGYLTAGGDALLNIAIRTFLAAKGRVTYQVGGAIVADSDPVAEYQETLIKGAAMAKALRGEG